MNRGFKFYFKKGRMITKTVLGRKKLNPIKYFVWLISYCFTNLFILIYPPFALANVNMAKNMKETGNLEIFSSFKDGDNPKGYISILFSMIVKLLMILGGFIVLVFITALLAGIGYLIGYMLENNDLSLILAISLGIPGTIITIIYLLIFPLLFKPINYIYSKKIDLNMEKVLYSSVSSMSKNGKKTLFAINFVSYFILILYLGVFGCLSYFLITNSTPMFKYIGLFVALSSFIVFLRILPRVILTKTIAEINLFDDIVTIYEEIEVVTEDEKIVEKVVKKKAKIKKKIVKTTSPEELLLSLFSDGSIKKVTNKEESKKSKSEDKEIKK